PLGLLGGLLLLHGVPIAERLGAVRFMRSLSRTRFRLQKDLTVSVLLETHGQAGTIADYLWRPLCISALNTPPAQASAQALPCVLLDALAGADGAIYLLLPRVDLSQLFPERAAEFVRGRGGEVRTGVSV